MNNIKLDNTKNDDMYELDQKQEDFNLKASDKNSKEHQEIEDLKNIQF